MSEDVSDPSSNNSPDVTVLQEASKSQASKTARKQWSSCDFCRERKKKCDALKRRDEGSSKCSRCFDYDIDCTFSFVSQKSTFRTARRRQSLAAKQVHARSADVPAMGPDMSLHEVPFVGAESSLEYCPQDPDLLPYDDVIMPTDDIFAPGIVDPFMSAALDLDGLDPHGGLPPSSFSMTDQEVLNILYPADTTTSLPAPSKMTFPGATREASQAGSYNYEPENATPFVPALILQRTASGLSKDLEWAMLQEYAKLGHTQMPVVDIDMIFLRYRYRTPTILPNYFVLALVACGSHYSSQKPEPGIDRRTARLLFDAARKELMLTAISELSIDALTALFIVYFHWQGDLTAFERGKLLVLSVQKLQALALHKEHVLCAGRSPRDIGVLRYLVWLVYIVDAFSGVSGSAVGDLEPASEPFQGAAIEVNQVTRDDMDALALDLLTGEPRPGWNTMRMDFSVLFNRTFASLSQLQNKIVRLQRSGQPVQHLRTELYDFENGPFSSCDVAYRTWDYERLVYVEFDGMTAAIISLNFAYWYCSLNFHFDSLRPHLVMDTSTGSSPSSSLTVTDNDLNETSIRACCKAFTSTISIFETLCSGSRLFQTSQVIRGELYFAGRVLQIFYKNRVKCANIVVVDAFLLSRWEKCLEISELVWGYSSKGIDLSRMSLEEVD